MKNLLAVVFAVAWLALALSVVITYAQDAKSPTPPEMFVPGSGLSMVDFFASGQCMMIEKGGSARPNPVGADNTLLCVRNGGGWYDCLRWEHSVKFTFFPLSGKRYPPLDAIGYPSDRQEFVWGGKYHLVTCKQFYAKKKK